jgi:signal peptidase I
MSTTSTSEKSQRGWLRSIGEIVIAFLVVMLAKAALAEPFYVPSASMEPTLLIGDALLASKYPYGYSTASLPINVAVPSSERLFGKLPERGDVVVFRWPGDTSEAWVKRVIGLPGDHIQMRNGHLWINGAAVSEVSDGFGQAEDESGSETPAARYTETLPGGKTHTFFKLRTHGPLDNTPEITVPAGDVFVMGDNRDNSADSRVPVAEGGVGLLPVDNLIGRVDTVVGSWDIAAKKKPIWNWPSGLRLARSFIAIH